MRFAYMSAVTVLSLAGFINTASAGGAHQHTAPTVKPPPFIATTEKPFARLMTDSMAVMDYGMANTPMDGNPDHDFAAMMIPHHQGAVDMAKAELLYGKNPVLRRLAQEIIVTQSSEIAVMQSELEKYSSSRSETLNFTKDPP